MTRTFKPHHRFWRWLLLTFFLLGMIFLITQYYVYQAIRENLASRLTQLSREDSLHIQFDHVSVNLWRGALEIQRLRVAAGDSMQPAWQASLPYVSISGIDLLAFISSHTLRLQHIVIEEPTMTVSSSFRLPGQEAQRNLLDKLHIGEADVRKAKLFVLDSVSRDSILSLSVQVSISRFAMDYKADTVIMRQGDLRISSLQLLIHKALYRFKIKQLRLSLADKMLRLDSLEIIPTRTRRDFMQHDQEQTDHISGIIPQLTLTGLQLYGYPSLSVQAKTLSTGMRLLVYRDKRYPFRQHRHKALPAHFLQKLPILIQVDSVMLSDSFISYEEYPASGDSAGGVYFDHLTATITPLQNQGANGTDVIMVAHAKFMGVGDLFANFLFPSDTTQPYRAAGNLRNFPLKKLNSMLGPATHTRITSGYLTNLSFDFMYTPLRASGQLELNYSDLRLQTLRETREHEASVALVKTWLINAFIIRKDMDGTVPPERKQGAISFVRDPRRSVFHYWWKSMLSGIKSAYKLDKLENVRKQASQRWRRIKRGR